MPIMTAIKIKATNIADGAHNNGHTLYVLPQISIFINNTSNFHQPANQIIKIISNGLTWLIYLILQLLHEISVLNPFPRPTTQDKKLTNTWKIRHETCTHRNMLPPTLGYQTSYQPSIQKLSKTRKRKSYAT